MPIRPGAGSRPPGRLRQAPRKSGPGRGSGRRRGSEPLALAGRAGRIGPAEPPRTETGSMMALPFVTLFAAVLCAFAGRRGAAIALWAVALALTLALFRLHATDILPLDF